MTIPAPPFPGYSWRTLSERWRLFDQPLETLVLSTRARNAARNMGWTCVGDIAITRPDELLRAMNLGRHTRDQITAALERLGLGLGEDPVGWPRAPLNLAMGSEALSQLQDALRLQAVIDELDRVSGAETAPASDAQKGTGALSSPLP